jgi:glycosyltransferase involved in cell wall biosynthesis
MNKQVKIIEIGTGYTSIPAKVGAATEIVVEELAISSIQKGMDVTIFDISDKNRTATTLPIKEVYLPGFIAGKVGYSLGIFHKIKRVWYSFSLAVKLMRHIKKENSYILHFHNQYNFFFFRMLSSARTRKNVKLFYTNHTYTWSLPWEEIKDLVKKKYFMENYSMKKADMVFVLNENTVKNLTDHVKIAPANVRLIPNGVNTAIYRKLDKNDESVKNLRKELGMEGKKVLFHAGTVCERKNQLEIIKYLTPAFKKDADLVLIYAGGVREDDYHAAIKDYCKEARIEQNVVYAGELKPGPLLNAYYNLAEAFVFFSKSEGFSLAMLEALSSGLPVLLSKNLEIGFIKGKDNGILIFEDQASFLSQLETQVFDAGRREHHSKLGSDFIENNYSWSRIVDKYFS